MTYINPRPSFPIGLGPNEGRDVYGTIHRAIPINNGRITFLRAACNRHPVGTNPVGLIGYCPLCFPPAPPDDPFADDPNIPTLDFDDNPDLN